MKQESWIYGTLTEISYIKNNSNQVETAWSFKLEKYFRLMPSEVINYLKFRAYSSGGVWDGVRYPAGVKLPKKVGEKVLIHLKN